MAMKHNLLTSATVWPVSFGIVVGGLGLAAAAAYAPCRVRCGPTRPAAANASGEALNPVAAKRPADPTAAIRVAASCTPCAAAACNPCNPCAAASCNPCNPCAAASPCNPCDPCAPGAAAEVPALGTPCRIRGNPLDCGRLARAGLMDLVAGGEVACSAAGPGEHRCFAGRYDVAFGLIHAGWAVPTQTAPTHYNVKMIQAEERGRGLWSAQPAPTLSSPRD